MSVRAAAAVVLLAGSALAQEVPKNAPHFVKTAKAPGLEVRYLELAVHYGDRRAKVTLAR